MSDKSKDPDLPNIPNEPVVHSDNYSQTKPKSSAATRITAAGTNTDSPPYPNLGSKRSKMSTVQGDGRAHGRSFFLVLFSIVVCGVAYFATQNSLTLDGLDKLRHLGASSVGKASTTFPTDNNEHKTESYEQMETIGNFRRIARVPLNSTTTDIVITKWRSEVTGLRVVHIDYESALFSIYSAFLLI
jgi:hypothetical protein